MISALSWSRSIALDMHEYKLHKRLEGLRADPSKVAKLVVYDDDGIATTSRQATQGI